MGGDYTRFTFDAAKGFSGVRKQQGRVSLDSEFNEFEAILDRRDRAETYDTVGQAVVPLMTPHGFEIGVNNAGKLTIGIGRAYVDGILTECFGDVFTAAATVRDDHLGGVVGPGPILYDQQPFAYASNPYVPSFPGLAGVAGAVNLLYLDVWQREVTVFEDYALREPALNGPDTTTRAQTAWQVKVMQGADAASCAAPPPAWTSLIAPSTARLTAQATPTAPAPGPCVINPAGGYTGLENRLYRVEIHKAGTLAGSGGTTKAQFKWSRDNASLAAKVLGIGPAGLATESIITVSSSGRDAWMRFEHDDHIELLDDAVELSMRESGTGGPMARILGVNHATGEIHIDKNLSNFPVIAARHPRIRRWDIASAAESLARDVNNGSAISLESGITITFSASGSDTLHAGDYWVFAARTADGTIDTLVNAPPRGVLHHFARLALVTSGTPPSVLTDCRIFWPPAFGHEGCCTAVVHPGEDIQKAIDSLAGVGGCVCLKMGDHEITNPLKIKQDNVTIHGEVPWVRVRRRAGPLMLEISAKQNVSVEGIIWEAASGAKPDPMIFVEGVRGGRVAGCALRIQDQKEGGQAIGIGLGGCRDYMIEENWISGLPTGVWAMKSNEIRVVGNMLDASSAKVPAGGKAVAGAIGLRFDGELAGICIERNVLTGYPRGIQLGNLTALPAGGPATQAQPGCRIVGNVVARGLEKARVEVRAKAGSLGTIAFAISARVARCEILENAMVISALQESGILVVGGDSLVARNEIRSTTMFDSRLSLDNLPFGVAVVATGVDVTACTVRENLFTGLQQPVFAIGSARVREDRVDVVENHVAGSSELVRAVVASLQAPGGGGPLAKLLLAAERYGSIVLGALDRARVADNEIQAAVCGVLVGGTTGGSICGNRITGSVVGIALLGVEQSDVRDNVIAGVTGTGFLGVTLLGARRSVAQQNAISSCSVGLLTLANTAGRVHENDVLDCDVGIASVLDFDTDVRGNAVEDAATSGIAVLLAVHELTLAHNRALRCGYRTPGGINPDPAIGIEVLYAIGLVTVDSCHVIDTGESAQTGDPTFTAVRYGIVLLYAIGARVHGCSVTSKPLLGAAATGINGASRAIRVWTLSPPQIINLLPTIGRVMTPFVDTTDNVIEQSGNTLVEVITLGEAIVATNRCTNFAGAQKVTMTAIIGTAVQAPSPYPSFNASA